MTEKTQLLPIEIEAADSLKRTGYFQKKLGEGAAGDLMEEIVLHAAAENGIRNVNIATLQVDLEGEELRLNTQLRGSRGTEDFSIALDLRFRNETAGPKRLVPSTEAEQIVDVKVEGVAGGVSSTVESIVGVNPIEGAVKKEIWKTVSDPISALGRKWRERLLPHGAKVEGIKALVTEDKELVITVKGSKA